MSKHTAPMTEAGGLRELRARFGVQFPRGRHADGPARLDVSALSDGDHEHAWAMRYLTTVAEATRAGALS